MTKRMKFRCTLKSDLIISQTSSTEGNQETLDFIPGNNFLGIVAGSLYDKEKLTDEQQLDIFHSGKVRFGDAHPSTEGIRGLKVPASMYYPKLGSASQECFIHHLTNHSDEAIKTKQLKQCREGFYIFKDEIGKKVQVQKNFSIKSAYDKETRRSKDGQMFGYESLSNGLVLYFEVESDLSDDINKKIEEILKKTKHIGHSRTAEYGVEEIEKMCEYLRKRQVKNDTIYSSSASRCVQSAKYIAKIYKKKFEVIDLRPRKCGGFSGLSFEQIETKFPDKLSDLINKPDKPTPEDAEPVTDFIKRISDAIDRIVEENIGNRVIIVTHPDVIKAAICSAIDISHKSFHRIHIKTGSATQISYFSNWKSLIYSDYTPL